MDNLPEPKIKNKYEVEKPINIKKLKTEKYLDKFFNKEFLQEYFKNTEKRTKN